jgi:SPP1 gp7 family putative phage head morphogenesis protein
MIAGETFNLAPEKAIEFYKDKGLRRSFAWQDMIKEEHAYAFTVAKMMDRDLLDTTKQLMDTMIAEGRTIQDFNKELIPHLQKKGWWGKDDVIDPLTGKVTNAQLGSPARLETIFRTNMQSAYAVGAWEAIEASKESLPYLMYDAIDDGRAREEHAKFDGLVLPVDHPFWKEHYPPNDYNCRCGTIQMDEDDVEDEGLEISDDPVIERKPWTNPLTGITEQLPVGVSPSFNFNAGHERMRILANAYMGKVKRQGSPADEVGHLLSSSTINAAFRSWLDNNRTATDERVWPIGTYSPRALKKLDDEGIKPTTGMIELNTAVARQSNLTNAELYELPDIIASPDAVYFHKSRRTVIYTRTNDDGTVTMVTTKTNGRAGGRAYDYVKAAEITTQDTLDKRIARGTFLVWQ